MEEVGGEKAQGLPQAPRGSGVEAWAGQCQRGGLSLGH